MIRFVDRTTIAGPRPDVFHPFGCDCRQCEPPVPSIAPRATIVGDAAALLAGIGAGTVLTIAAAWITGAPGIGVVFGL